MGKLYKAFQKRAIPFFSLGLARGAHGTDGGAMVVPVPVHDFVLALSGRIYMGCLPDNLKGFLIGFRAGI